MATVGPNRALFDLWSRFYDLPWVQRAVYRAPQDAVIRELAEAGSRRVLDVGCGTGQLAARVRRELRGTRVVGCDFSAGMLDQARKRDRQGPWVRGDAGRLPFRRGRFDAVVSTEAFHWFPDPRRALREFRRVLRPKGVLLLALVNPRFGATGRIFNLVSGAVGQPFYWPTQREMRRLVRGAGFHLKEQQRLFRIPGALFVPPVLTVATVRPGRERILESFAVE